MYSASWEFMGAGKNFIPELYVVNELFRRSKSNLSIIDNMS